MLLLEICLKKQLAAFSEIPCVRGNWLKHEVGEGHEGTCKYVTIAFKYIRLDVMGNKIGRNQLCPCGSGKKYKHCCENKVDWNQIRKKRLDTIPHLSIRGRNLLFVNKIAEALQLDSTPHSMKYYKAAFTKGAVIKIHEALMEIWTPDIDIHNTLKNARSDVSGLYIGDYEPEYILKGLVRHSTYSNKLLVVDPFIYPLSVREKFNPILKPEQYRTQTLKNVNFWFLLFPWIEAGIVEIIRTPADFDPKLNWESMKQGKQKYEENKEFRKAVDKSVSELSDRHLDKRAIQLQLLSAPNSYLEKLFDESELDKKGLTSKGLISFIEQQREADPDFLETLDKISGQLHIFSAGGNYNVAMLTANLTDSYLVTDLYAKWKEIEIDRENTDAKNKEWTPFAKAFQNLELKFLNNLSLEHALILRKENRLESLRVFLRKVWKSARTTDQFSEANAKLLAEELNEEIIKAEEEWKQIDRNLLKWIGAELGSGIAAAGPMIASGYGQFLAAAIATAGTINLGVTQSERKSFKSKYPAAFFLKLK